MFKFKFLRKLLVDHFPYPVVYYYYYYYYCCCCRCSFRVFFHISISWLSFTEVSKSQVFWTLPCIQADRINAVIVKGLTELEIGGRGEITQTTALLSPGELFSRDENDSVNRSQDKILTNKQCLTKEGHLKCKRRKKDVLFSKVNKKNISCEIP